MMQRCFNPNNPQYSNYGGRDITVHERWFDFENYYTDVGDPPPGMSLDRINNDGDYQPWNWQWATQSMQNYNQRRSLKKADKPVIKRGLGRPKGSKNKPKRRRGRPLGSKNKPKLTGLVRAMEQV